MSRWWIEIIKLTEKDVDVLIERGYRNHVFELEGKKMNTYPWYKVYPIIRNLNFEIVINPCGIDEDIVVGCIGMCDEFDGVEGFVGAMEIFNEIADLKKLLIDGRVKLR